MKTVDELMRLHKRAVEAAHLYWGGVGSESSHDAEKAALRSALEEVVRDAERYRMLSRMLFHGDFEVGEAYVTMKIVGACPCPADLDREVDAAIDSAMQQAPEQEG